MMLATLKGLFNPVKTRQQSAKLTAIVYAILAAALYALNMPLSKLLLQGQYPPKSVIPVDVDPVQEPGVFHFGQARQLA